VEDPAHIRTWQGLAYGLYDGLTGFVVQPCQGAKEHGAKGFLKGFGKGLGGIVFKPAGGMVSPFIKPD
jgi:hypothetical protein